MKVQRPQVMTTTVRLSPGAWTLLRAMAAAKAIAEGGRPNTGAIVEQLVEAEAVRRAAVRADA